MSSCIEKRGRGFLIYLDDTNFKRWGKMASTNLAGDPNRNKWHNDTRDCELVIPDEQLALEMIDLGFNVRKTGELEDSIYPTEYYIRAIANYKTSNNPPRIYLVEPNCPPVLMDEESVGRIDLIDVSNVNVVLNSWVNQKGTYTLFIDTMYVEQALQNDPYAERYFSGLPAGGL